MNKLISIALFVTFSVSSFSVVFAGGTSIVKKVLGDAVFVINPLGQSQVIHVSHPVSKDDISYEDLNFDGYMDIKVLASAGNVEKFYDVYLFNAKTKRYELSKEFSNVPCVAVDPKVRQVIGTCFHTSACENWIERYSVDHLNRLHLRSRQGTYCDPSTGDAFSYIDLFRNGKHISSKSTQLYTDGEKNRK